jgi:hypothetical protein
MYNYTFTQNGTQWRDLIYKAVENRKRQNEMNFMLTKYTLITEVACDMK